jgi:hypothetical protein
MCSEVRDCGTRLVSHVLTAPDSEGCVGSVMLPDNISRLIWVHVDSDEPFILRDPVLAYHTTLLFRAGTWYRSAGEQRNMVTRNIYDRPRTGTTQLCDTGLFIEGSYEVTTLLFP